MTLQDQLTQAADADRSFPFDSTAIAAGAHRRRLRRRGATGALALGVVVAAVGLAVILQQGADSNDTDPVIDPPSTTLPTGNAQVLTSDRWIPVVTDPSPIGAILPVFDFGADGTLTAGSAWCGRTTADWTLADEAIVVDIVGAETAGFGACQEPVTASTDGALASILDSGTIRIEGGPTVQLTDTRTGKDAAETGGPPAGASATLRRVADIGTVPNSETIEDVFVTPDGTFVRFQPDGLVLIGACEARPWDLSDGMLEVGLGPRETGSGGCPPATEEGEIARLIHGSNRVRRMDNGELLIDGELGAVRLDPEGLGPISTTTNLLEQTLFAAFDAMGVEQCCGEPSHGSSNALTGFVWEGESIFVVASPIGDLLLDDSVSQPPTEITVNPGRASLVVSERGETLIMRCPRIADISFSGFSSEGVGAFVTPQLIVIGAAEALANALGCVPEPIPVDG